MSNDSTKPPVRQSEAETTLRLLDDWFDPIEAALRDQVRSFIQAMIEAELKAVLARPRYCRQPKTASDNTNGAGRISGHRHGHRSRSLMGTFGRVDIAMPRARLNITEGRTTEWKSTALRQWQAPDFGNGCADGGAENGTERGAEFWKDSARMGLEQQAGRVLVAALTVLVIFPFRTGFLLLSFGR
jgi:hypothetical protein